MGISVIILLAVIIVFIAITYNSLVRLRNTAEEAFATMDVFLTKRYDLIPNLVETVKGYAAHEAGTLERVVKARNMAADANSMEKKIEGENMLTGALRNLFALSEAYPDLKANTNFLDLQSQLQKIENDIANARRNYNIMVKRLNIKIEMFPSNFIASLFRFGKKPLFEVSDPEKREAVRVEF